ncbi:MAG: chitobiase/beta-hexosaminidase C-terminal domain-containing protein [Bacteroidales bacterium]|nr:chitobiase/beta-hexosaminidase C-terminal domain-containing protein [Bacteroidales bacterium]
MKRLITVLSFTVIFAFTYGQGLETFDNSTATTSYADGSFSGNGGIVWNYFHSRDDGGYPVDGEGLMLRRASDSKLEASAIPGGIGSFSMNMRKAFTGSSVRQLEVYINGELKGTSIEFGGFTGADATIHTFEVNDINVQGNFDIRIKLTGTATTNRQVVIDNISWTAFGEVTAAATPVFSQFSGEYFYPFNLEITCTTEGATIYYTLDGSDPDNSSTEYTVPIPIDATTTVKAIAYAPDLDPSSIAEATYTFPPVTEVANLAELRAAYLTKTDYFKVTGEVVLTFKQTFRNQKFIQDATAAILIDDVPGVITTDYLIGDGITGIVGTFTYFGNMLQFNPVGDPGAPTSSGNVIDPEVVTIGQLFGNFEEYESELIKIEGVTFSDGGSLFANGQVYEITDESKSSGNFRTTFYDVDYIGTPIPTSLCNLVGIPNGRVDGFYFTSRSLDDIEIPPTITVISPNGGEQIEWGTEYEIEWFYSNFDGDVEVILHTPFIKEGVLLGIVPVEDGSFTWNVTQEFGEYIIIIQAVGQDDPWDASNETFTIVPPIDIIISEIMYNPPESGADTLEFIEFYNNGLGIVNLLNWKISKGVVYTFPDVDFHPGEFLVVCVNASAFQNTFGIDALQWTSGGLGNGGEAVELSDNSNNVRAYVLYDDANLWPTEPAGRGPSLEFCDPSLDNNDPANWTFSTQLAAVNAAGQGIYCTPGSGCNENPTLPLIIPSGWSGVSSNLIPGRISMEDLFAPALNNLIIILSNEGIYWPGQNINSIGEWSTYTGYKAKLDGSAFFVFPGYEPEDKTITLEPGTHLIPVLSQNPVDVNEFIVPLGNAIEFMFDIAGGLIYWPGGGILPGTSGLSLNTLYPGVAYIAKVNAQVMIDFGLILPKAMTLNNVPQFVNSTSWNDVTATGSQHILSVTGAALQNLVPGDFVGIFNSNERCVGMNQFSGNESVLPIVVYGNDITTETIEGMVEGEMMTVRIFRNGQILDAIAGYSKQAANADGLYAENGLSIINGLKVGATGISEIDDNITVSPNPTSEQININTDGLFNLLITNVQGQVVFSGVIDNKTSFDFSNQPDGVYFIRLINEHQTFIEKVIKN